MAKKAKKITVEWTGAYPNLCSGQWLIKINGKLVRDIGNEDMDGYHREVMPKYGSVLRGDMNTSGTYQSWHFEDWSEVFEDYYAGDDFSAWVKSETGKKLLALIEKNEISLSKEDKRNLFEQLQENDWRSGSCGGCI